jgi:hypothetical protein
MRAINKIYFVFLLTNFAWANIYTQSTKSDRQNQQLINENWKQLYQQLPDYKENIVNEVPTKIEFTKVGAIADKAFEVEGQSVFFHALVYSTFEKRDASLEKIEKNPPIPNKQQFLLTNHNLIIWIYTNREDEDAQWILWGIGGALQLDE